MMKFLLKRCHFSLNQSFEWNKLLFDDDLTLDNKSKRKMTSKSVPMIQKSQL